MAYAPITRAVRREARPDKGRRRSKEIQATGNTASFVADGFLKHLFLPVTDTSHNELSNYRKVEKDFFKSLSHLSNLYGFPMPDVSAFVFPLNVQQAFEYAKACLHKINPKLELFILQERATFLATAKIFDTGNALYYLSVYPLVRLTENKEYKTANMLLSIFSYLYRIAGIPFYSDDCSYVGGQYESIENWIKEDGEEYDEKEEQLLQLQRISYQGKRIKRKISSLKNVRRFERRLHKFEAITPTDINLLKIGRQFLRLLMDYPLKNIFHTVCEGLIEPHEDERILPEYYLSFMYDYKDCLSDTLFTSVSEHLNNCGVIDEPVAFQYFDKEQQQEQHNLDYQKRLFELLDELIELLKEISDEEYNGVIL